MNRHIRKAIAIPVMGLISWGIIITLIFLVASCAQDDPSEPAAPTATFAKGGSGKPQDTLEKVIFIPDSIEVEPSDTLMGVVRNRLMLVFYVNGTPYLLRKGTDQLYRIGDSCLKDRPKPITLVEATDWMMVLIDSTNAEIDSIDYLGVDWPICPR